MTQRAEFQPIDGVECVTCGDVQPTADGRCPRCSKPLPQVAKRTQPSESEQKPIQLPNTPKTRAWLKLTRELSDELADDAKRLDDQVKQKQDEARQARSALSLFRQMRSLFAPLEPHSDVSVSSRLRPGEQWSKRFVACIRCGTTERRHLARGYCTSCYAPAMHGAKESV